MFSKTEYGPEFLSMGYLRKLVVCDLKSSYLILDSYFRFRSRLNPGFLDLAVIVLKVKDL